MSWMIPAGAIAGWTSHGSSIRPAVIGAGIGPVLGTPAPGPVLTTLVETAAVAAC